MTLRESLEYGTNYLKEQGIDDASQDAWLLLEFVAGIDRGYYLLHKNELFLQERLENYQDKVKQRAAHIPLQYITGEQEFMGFPFYVTKDVLIPRQDTEILVEEVLKLGRDSHKILDLCTGSGCIAISLQKLLKGAEVYGVDISSLALVVAKKNAERNDAKIEWIESDLFEKVQGCFDLIVSNPPYIRTAVIKELMTEVKEHEPLLALDGKEDGLYFYREIIRESISHLNAGGFLCFEIGYDQGSDLRFLMEEQGFQEVRVVPDLAGLDRVVVGRAKEY